MGTASLRTGVTVQFGLLSIPTSVQTAVEPEPANRTVCLGGGTHDPVRITMPITCPECGPVKPYQTTKAREVGDRLVPIGDLLSKRDVTAYAQSMALAAHPAGQVDLGTINGEHVYYLVPMRGAEHAYAALTAFVDAHPELAFVTQWAPRSRVGLFRLGVTHQKGKQPVLTMFERLAVSRLRAAPELPVEADTELVTLLEKALKANRRTLVSAFKPEAYLDDTEDQIQAALASLAPVDEPRTDPTLVALTQMAQRPARARKPKAKAEQKVEAA